METTRLHARSRRPNLALTDSDAGPAGKKDPAKPTPGPGISPGISPGHVLAGPAPSEAKQPHKLPQLIGRQRVFLERQLRRSQS